MENIPDIIDSMIQDICNCTEITKVKLIKQINRQDTTVSSPSSVIYEVSGVTWRKYTVLFQDRTRTAGSRFRSRKIFKARDWMS